jgi:hypothetical protein
MSGTNIVQSEAAENLDLLDLSDKTGTSTPDRRRAQSPSHTSNYHLILYSLLADVKQVNRIVIPFKPGERMFEVWALPCLRDRTVQEGVGYVWPDVLHESRGAFSGVVEDGV